MTEQPPHGGGNPPPGYYPPAPQQGGYPPPPQQGGYPPPPQSGGYPPPQHGGYPPPPQQGGYPPGGYPPPPPGGYPPPPPGGGGYPPPQGAGYPQGYPGTAQGVGSLPQEAYTSWIARVGAYLIDVIPVAIVCGVIAGIFTGIAAATAQNSTCTDSDGNTTNCSTLTGFGWFMIVLAYVIPIILGLAYTIWNYGYRQGTTGSSIGKSVLKFKVVSEATGQPIGFGMSILRQIAHIVDSIICNIGYLFPLWDQKRQTLADKIMSTVCLPTEGAAPATSGPPT
jgi:uncharacterized RDD family membrane protein YckC